ncbi:hypothetical protein SAMN05421835_12368 [Amycolatopsis sacchari]|uniref:Uncharacterized protein n=1 Tax=Amycolatopsis sacchari TaxID=115433 RepID=A0A1I4AA50_9PSEU|nr:hypothetical protein [Amycolatopsis sacchari]SFK52659.1 hypothetical protein SAMN05421835_12368 [Amycolatopsis sacchari]
MSLTLTNKPAGDLRVGDWVVLHDGLPAPVTKLTHTADRVTILTDQLRVSWPATAPVPVIGGGRR